MARASQPRKSSRKRRTNGRSSSRNSTCTRPASKWPRKIEPMPPVHAITFDVGGTLIQPWPSVGHVYAEVAARHGIKPEAAETLNQRFAAAWKKLKDFHHKREEGAGGG